MQEQDSQLHFEKHRKIILPKQRGGNHPFKALDLPDCLVLGQNIPQIYTEYKVFAQSLPHVFCGKDFESYI